MGTDVIPLGDRMKAFHEAPTNASVVEVEVLEALTKRVLQLERDRRSLEDRLTKVEKKLNTIAMRHSD